MSRAARRFKKRAKRLDKDVERLVDAARHEAAHAVVAARLGLPLASTDIRSRSMQESQVYKGTAPRGWRYQGTEGYTTLRPGTADAWVATRPGGP